MASAASYVELHARSAFNFLRGGALPEQMAEVARELELPAMALHDRDGVYGAPRFYQEATKLGLRAIIGCELTMEDGSILPVLVESREGYRNLCRLITQSKLRGTKTESHLRWDELPEFSHGLVALTGDAEGPLAKLWKCNGDPRPLLDRLCGVFGKGNVFIEIQRHLIRGEQRQNQWLAELARSMGLPLLATNGVSYARPEQRCVLDLFTCIRNHTTFEQAGRLLEINAEGHLKSGRTMEALFTDLPEAIENTKRLADRLDFSLEKLGYEFPKYPVAEGWTMESYLIEKTMEGARKRYGTITPPVGEQLRKELELINRLGFAGYFLIVWDLVNFCREQNIMVQGRGSAANSAVCYSLGITYCDPVSNHLLFERFLTENRKTWPDIDLDLPSGDRREKVIQEVYKRYGKHGAAMTANVITYRGRSAMREVGKALGISGDVLDRFSSLYANGDFPHTLPFSKQMEKAGISGQDPRAAACTALCHAVHGLPRHLGQHSGGMVICQGALSSIVPLENASMPGRVVIQWDKVDCENLGLIKVDLLGLGMMSVLQDVVELTAAGGGKVDLAQIPTDDPAVYDMLCQADTIGVFQVESRAQMATLPHLKPREFYDLVIEVAIIRPGPIQGGLMHPYLKRRSGLEEPACYTPELQDVLGRTLGVPLFQEQMLKMAMVVADLSGAEAEELRRALSFHRSKKEMDVVEENIRTRMERRGVAPKVREEILKAITSFALYGFPESHAISFAHLAYCSAYFKVHYAPEFYTGLLNNQPMGFYSSATLIQDGKRHGVKFRPVCLERSDWECTIEPDRAVRLGFCVVQGLGRAHALAMLEQRARRGFTSITDLRRRSPLSRDELRVLAEIGALNCLAKHRRDALWQAEAFFDPDDLFAGMEGGENKELPLAAMSLPERLQADHQGMRLSLGPHTMALLRPNLGGIHRAADLSSVPNGQVVRIAGSVICRQRPGTAKGFVFISLEDETGVANAIVTPAVFEEMRLLITEEPFLVIEGPLQNLENVIHIKARKIEPLPHEEFALAESHDFR